MSAVLAVLFRLLEVLFFVGIAGSMIVIVITTVQDFGLLFEADEPPTGTSALGEESRFASGGDGIQTYIYI
jgi:hypothetical protein